MIFPKEIFIAIGVAVADTGGGCDLLSDFIVT
jgi:hypothetical protein